MRNFLFILVSIVAMFTSCSNDIIEETLTTNVVFTPTFNEEYSPMSRATTDIPAIKNFYIYEVNTDNSTTLLLHQTTTSNISLNLTYGMHKLKFIATNAVDAQVSENIISWAAVKDTYIGELDLNVVSGLTTQTVSLSRIVGKISLKSTDAIPENAATAQFTINRHNGFDIATMTVNELANISNSVNIPSANTGKTGADGVYFDIYSLTDPNESFTTDVAVLFKDASGNTITSFVIPNVTVKHNTNTILTGAVFNRNTGMALDFNQDWKEAVNLTF